MNLQRIKDFNLSDPLVEAKLCESYGPYSHGGTGDFAQRFGSDDCPSPSYNLATSATSCAALIRASRVSAARNFSGLLFSGASPDRRRSFGTVLPASGSDKCPAFRARRKHRRGEPTRQ